MSAFTKVAPHDRAIAEMSNSKTIPGRRIGEGLSLRTSNGAFDISSDSESDVSCGSSGSYGSLGRNSFISISEDNNSPLSMSASYAFMASARGSRMLQEEELARLGDMPLDLSGEIPAPSPGIERTSIRSPNSFGKDKRAEYFAKIKSEFMQANFPSTPPPTPPTSSPPEPLEDWAKRAHRFSLAGRVESDRSQDSDTPDEKGGKRDKDEKKREKEKQKEEKLKKKLEKKELKLRKTQQEKDCPSPTLDNPRIMQQLLGAMRPRASLSQRGAMELEEQLKKPLDSSLRNSLRRSTSFINKEDVEPGSPVEPQLRPKYEKILGPVDMAVTIGEDKHSWRKTKIVPDSLTIPPFQLPPPPPPPTILEPDYNELSFKQQRRIPKFQQILGENPQQFDIETVVQPAVAIEMDIDEEGIVFAETQEQSGHRQVKGATLKKLVERLTCESISDTNFLLQFIITYRSFTNPHELLELLKDRYANGIEISPSINEGERETLNKKKQIVRLRVYNVIRQWIDKQWMDFLEDPSLVEKMLCYAPMFNEVATKSSAIDSLIAKKLAEGEKQKTIMFSVPPPSSYIPTVPKDKLQVMDINSEEIARQMTLMEYSLFKAIKPWEYLCWNTKMKTTKSANILTMINKFNVMSKWVQREVIHSGDQPKQRAAIIGKFLEICEHLRILKNFNGIMEILSGLNASAIHRLRNTWACLSSKQTESFQEFNTFTTGKNYSNLRNALHTLQPPCIPYLGMYLTDLTFINDGIPLYLSTDSNLINFDKCRKVSASVLEIMQYQQTPFCLSPVEEIQSYLVQVEKKQTETEDDIYKLSLSLEERK